MHDENVEVPPPKLYFDPIVTTDSADCVIPFSRAGNLIAANV